MASSAQIRIWWADWYAQGYTGRLTFLGREGVKFHATTLEAWKAMESALTINGYGKASIVSTYNVRNIAGTDIPSIHSYSGCALDIDPEDNPSVKTRPFSWADTRFTAEQVDAVKRIRTKNDVRVWKWGGDEFDSDPSDDVHYQDYMHWQINCSPADLATGIDWSTVDGGDMRLGIEFWETAKKLGGLLPTDNPWYYTPEGIPGTGARATFDEMTHAWSEVIRRLVEGRA